MACDLAPTTCVVWDSVFDGNQAFFRGAGVQTHEADADLLRNTFCFGIADGMTVGDGGAVAILYNPNTFGLELRNNTFLFNNATDLGGAVFVLDSAFVVLTNSTFVGNEAFQGGATAGVDAGNGTSVTFSNNIVIDTLTTDAAAGAFSLDANSVAVGYGYNTFHNNVGGNGSSGDGLFPVLADPLLVNVDPKDCDANDVHLQKGSPSIGAGWAGRPNPGDTISDAGTYGGPEALWDHDGDGADNDIDCDDADPTVSPLSEELCDPYLVDEDCDGHADDADPGGATGSLPWYHDGDGDGLGAGPVVQACLQPANHVSVDGDCDDADPLVGILPAMWYDTDGDGFGDDQAPVAACDTPKDAVDNDVDCDDDDPTSFPGAPELCDEADNDCDEVVDNDIVYVDWWPDTDADTYGNGEATPIVDCSQPDGFVDNPDDCDDGVSTTFPGAVEVCNDVDDDCNDEIDDGCVDPPVESPPQVRGPASAPPPVAGCRCDAGPSSTPAGGMALALLLFLGGRRRRGRQPPEARTNPCV